MASESTSPADLSAIPSSVSGDGTTFVKGLKKYLEKYDSNVDAKISNIGEGSVNQVTSLRLTEEHRTNASGNVNDIRVEFDTTNVSDYAFAQIWMRKGTNGTWIQQGNTSGVQYVIEDVKADTSNKYYVKVIACNNNAGYSDFATAPMEEITIRGSVLLCNTPTQFYWSNDDRKWHWSGYTDNGYTDFFEIRTDQNAGIWNEHRLDAIPAGTYYSTVMPTTRSGTAYLYVRNVFGQYNSPATHQYSITAPAKPTKATLEVVTDGVKVTLQGLPSGCTNYVVDVDGVEYEVLSSPWTSYTFFGSIAVKYCFVDSVGRGPWSDSNSITTGRLITSTEITDGAISTPKLAANSITAGKIAANTITAGCIASNAITSDKINAGAITAGKIATGAITIGGSGREVSIADGAINGSKITAASIIGDKIAANTISASKLKAETITLSNALKIVGGSVTLDGNGLKCTTSSNGSVTFNGNGMSFADKNGNTYSRVGRMLIGTASHGQYVRFNNAWENVPTVIVMPRQFQTMYAGYNSTNLENVCQAINVTTSGFTVQCYTRLLSGSSGASGGTSIGTITTSEIYNHSNTWYNKSVGSTTLTIPSSATHIEVNVNGWARCEKDWASGGDSNDGAYVSGGKAYIIIRLIVNDTAVKQIQSTTDESGEGQASISGTLTYDFTAGSTIKVDAILYFYEYTGGYGGASGGASVSSYSYSLNNGATAAVGTGSATFIAIENPNAYYSIG